jgi:hypothetical protein
MRGVVVRNGTSREAAGRFYLGVATKWLNARKQCRVSVTNTLRRAASCVFSDGET